MLEIADEYMGTVQGDPAGLACVKTSVVRTLEILGLKGRPMVAVLRNGFATMGGGGSFW